MLALRLLLYFFIKPFLTDLNGAPADLREFVSYQTTRRYITLNNNTDTG